MVPWYLHGELHGDPSRGSPAALRLRIGRTTIVVEGLGAADGSWAVDEVRAPHGEDRRWAASLACGGRQALLSMDLRARSATIHVGGDPTRFAWLPAPVPGWLVGRWRVDASRLSSEEAAELGPGVIEVSPSSLAHHSFGPKAQIFDQTWSGPSVTELEGGLVRVECNDFDDVRLDVKARDGDRLLVYLGGMDALPWGREMPLVRDPSDDG